jgi:hypothetical protein
LGGTIIIKNGINLKIGKDIIKKETKIGEIIEKYIFFIFI